MSQVMNAVRGVATGYKVPVPKPVLHPTSAAPMPEVVKRKTPIKKTVEFKPEVETIPTPIPPIKGHS